MHQVYTARLLDVKLRGAYTACLRLLLVHRVLFITYTLHTQEHITTCTVSPLLGTLAMCHKCAYYSAACCVLIASDADQHSKLDVQPEQLSKLHFQSRNQHQLPCYL
jgi:hypothetical protein